MESHTWCKRNSPLSKYTGVEIHSFKSHYYSGVLRFGVEIHARNSAFHFQKSDSNRFFGVDSTILSVDFHSKTKWSLIMTPKRVDFHSTALRELLRTARTPTFEWSTRFIFIRIYFRQCPHELRMLCPARRGRISFSIFFVLQYAVEVVTSLPTGTFMARALPESRWICALWLWRMRVNHIRHKRGKQHWENPHFYASLYVIRFLQPIGCLANWYLTMGKIPQAPLFGLYSFPRNHWVNEWEQIFKVRSIHFSFHLILFQHGLTYLNHIPFSHFRIIPWSWWY